MGLFSKKPKKEEKKNQANQKVEPKKINVPEVLAKGLTSVKDIIAPAALEVDFNHLKIGDNFYRTLFIAGYPRFVNANWLSPLINFHHSINIAIYIYPVEVKDVLDDLRRKIGEMEAEIQTDIQQGKIVDIETKVKLEDAQDLQEQLAKGAERFFQFGLYITISAKDEKKLDKVTKQVQSTLGSVMIVSKVASLQIEDAFKTTLPTCNDKLMITRNMDTTSLATTFPFTSSELTANEGVLYGINEHNDSLVIFDRFTMENANALILAKSGSGKSYMVKLEVLRSLMFDTEIIIVDPEGEYRTLCDAVGGEYIDFSFDSPSKINPFDLAAIREEGENELGNKILSLSSLFKIIMGKLSATEESILDKALVLTYKQKGITADPITQKKEAPLMEDLYKSLIGMESKEALEMAARLEKYIKGSLRGVFDQHSTVDIKSPFTVFCIRELEDKLRPIAMFIILDFIWTKVKKELKRRILVVDEAWYLMKHEDSATFLYGIAKRARKYYLGVTTISQDVEDFLNSEHGKAIVTNSSIQILMRQSPAAIDTVGKVFYLSQGEKNLLLSAEVGRGLFFAGNNHVAVKVVSSKEEHALVTSKPQDLVKAKEDTLEAKKQKLSTTTHMEIIEGDDKSKKLDTNVLDTQQLLKNATPEPSQA
ncbi:VirB4-like conjugal transfer ATPase, CD1110 family [Patescibacteria group bacterium]